jgi:hypothetical protein
VEWIWPASRLIQRHGRLPGGLPGRVGLGLRLEALVFELLEGGLRIFSRNVAEEIVMVLRKH